MTARHRDAARALDGAALHVRRFWICLVVVLMVMIAIAAPDAVQCALVTAAIVLGVCDLALVMAAADARLRADVDAMLMRPRTPRARRIRRPDSA